jgi:hypothetical protein
MPKGLRLPVAVNPRGGAQTVEDFQARRQNVILGVKPASSLHPWNQQLTPPEELIFNIADEMSGGQLVAHIYSFFEEQEKLGLTRLSKGSDGLKLDLSRSQHGEMELVINYTDLEDNSSREVRFGPGSK